MRGLFLAVALALAGCQTFSFSDALGSAYAAVDVLADTTLELCAAPIAGGECTGSIATEVRDQVRDQLNLALELLDEARQHHVDGSADLAQQRIAHARSILRVVERLVEVQT